MCQHTACAVSSRNILKKTYYNLDIYNKNLQKLCPTKNDLTTHKKLKKSIEKLLGREPVLFTVLKKLVG